MGRATTVVQSLVDAGTLPAGTKLYAHPPSGDAGPRLTKETLEQLAVLACHYDGLGQTAQREAAKRMFKTVRQDLAASAKESGDAT